MELLIWFDMLFIGANTCECSNAPPLPRKSGAFCLADCEASMTPSLSQRIKPPPSPAMADNLKDSLGLPTVRPDDLLLALLVICDIVPPVMTVSKEGNIWLTCPSRAQCAEDMKIMFKGYYLWAQGDDNGRPTRLTWGNYPPDCPY